MSKWTGLKAGERPFRDAAWYYAEYRYRPSEAFMPLLASELGLSRSDRVLDLGAGPAHLSLRLAPFVREVVVMDPEPAMIEEGRRRAAPAEVDNLSFVLGGSDDLAGLSPGLGTFAAVTISQAFHWMADQDRVLRELDDVLAERGAVAIVGYVKEPDYNLIWIDRPPWSLVTETLRGYLADVPEGPHPAGRHDPFPEILARSPFSAVELLEHEYDAVVRPSIEAALGYLYSVGGLLARLGDQRSAFEADVREALADADTSRAPYASWIAPSSAAGRDY